MVSLRSIRARVVLAALAVAGPGGAILGDVINVPADFATIQSAIDAAADSDEIVVAPGTYFEAINFLGKAITLRSSDGPEVTIIDGTGHFHVVQCVNEEGADTVLDGFTITGGDANGSDPDNRGGGMFNSSSPTVNNCIFTGNSADVGGAMGNSQCSPIVNNCMFIANSASSGGAMYNAQSNPMVTKCVFSGNVGLGGGGGMFNNVSSMATVVDCTFIDNSAPFGGGMLNVLSSPTVINCNFLGNLAHFVSGGASGGGIANSSSSAIVVGCTFVGNSTDNIGGGLYNQDCCGFSNTPVVINCTVAGNTAAIAGGGMLNLSISAWAANCVFWGNLPDQVNDMAPAAGTLLYCDVQGGWPGSGAANIDADPAFVDPDGGDFRLLPGSPCIDAGNNNAVADLTATDLDGNPRFADDPDAADTGCGVPVVVDMGAYEYQGDPAKVLFGDVNGDGRVGLADLLALIQCMGSDDPACCVADLNIDGEVDMADVALLIPELTRSVGSK